MDLMTEEDTLSSSKSSNSRRPHRRRPVAGQGMGGRPPRAAGTTVRGLTCADRDNPNRYYTIVEFPSHEEAMRNSDLPATQEVGPRSTRLCVTVRPGS